MTAPLTVWSNANVLTMNPNQPGLGVIEHGVIVAQGDRILAVGPAADVEIPAGATVIDCEGRWVTPGLIDCHTHVVYAGNRAKEFEMRLQGATYAEIARAGGGIRSTVAAVQAASVDELIAQSLPRIDDMMTHGTTTVEIKSGYGLTLEDELKQLHAADRLHAARNLDVVTTWLAAHAVPDDAIDPETYIETVIGDWMDRIIAESRPAAIDMFCERIAFLPEQLEPLLDAASARNLPVKLHADQLSDLDGAALAARYHALSADHLEYANESGIAAMAESGTTAVLLPGAYYFLRETHRPNVDALRRCGIPIAIATDCNPGTSPITSLPLVMNMSATLFGLTVEECLLGVTRNAARALHREQEIGSLQPGLYADLAIWDINEPAELVYHIGGNRLWRRIWHGEPDPA